MSEQAAQVNHMLQVLLKTSRLCLVRACLNYKETPPGLKHSIETITVDIKGQKTTHIL